MTRWTAPSIVMPVVWEPERTPSSPQTAFISPQPPCPRREAPMPRSMSATSDVSPAQAHGHCEKDTSQDHETSAFVKLHEPLVRQIHSLLPPESQTALALVSKTTLSLLGPVDAKGTRIKPWPMSPETRSALLKLLDRDLGILVYCSICDQIHGPLDVIGRSCTNALIKDRVPPPGDWARKTFVYFLPDFNFVHAVMRSHRAGRRDYLELRSVGLGGGVPLRRSPELLFSRGAVVERERIVTTAPDGAQASMVWMLQKVFPVSPPYNKTASNQHLRACTVRNFYEIGCYIRWAPRICDHRHWHKEYPFLLTNSPKLHIVSKSPLDSILRRKADLRTKFQKFHLDPREFRGPRGKYFGDSEKLVNGMVDRTLRCAMFDRGGPGDKCRPSMGFGVVRSCDRCDTDYCFTVVSQKVSDPEVGANDSKIENFFVFTSWKNLGSGGDSREDDSTWQAHVSNSPRAELAIQRKLQRTTSFLWPYTQYGKLEESPSEYGRYVYTPKLDPRLIRRARSWLEPPKPDPKPKG